MTPQERQLVDDLFDRLAKVENAPRDPDASAAILEGLRKAPNAIYALVQTVLLQDEALKRANAHIQELEAAQAPHQQQSGGFLDSMRDSIFGPSGQPRSSVPNVQPPETRPVWNSGQVMPHVQPPGYPQAGYEQPGYGQMPYGQPYGAPPFGGGGGSFLGTAAAAAAGAVGGSLLLNGIRSMMGGSRLGLADPASIDRAASPWSNQSDSTLARDAGINDIGTSRDHADDNSRTGLLDQSSDDPMSHDDQIADNGDDDRDDADMDADDRGNDDGDFGNDGGSDYA